MSDESETVEPFRFDWHQLDESDNFDGFLRWMVVNVLVRESDVDATAETLTDEQRTIDRVSDASNGFHDLTMTIQLNGIEVNARYFVERIRSNMDHWTKREAARLLTSSADAVELQAIANILQFALRRRAEQVAESLGLELDEEDQ